MKKENKILISLLLFFTSGQIFIAKDTVESFGELVKEGMKISLSNQYFIEESILWELIEQPENARGIIAKEDTDVNYVYRKVDKGIWNDKKTEHSENKATMPQPLMTGGMDGEIHSHVGALMSELSGKIIYGEYKNDKAKRSWF